MFYLYRARRFTNLDQLPHPDYVFGLIQHEPWSNLEFLRERSLRNLALSTPGSACDLSPIADMHQLHRLICHEWKDLGGIPSPPGLTEIDVEGPTWRTIDVRPLRTCSMKVVTLRRCDAHVGIGELGPDVKVKWRN